MPKKKGVRTYKRGEIQQDTIDHREMMDNVPELEKLLGELKDLYMN